MAFNAFLLLMSALRLQAIASENVPQVVNGYIGNAEIANIPSNLSSANITNSTSNSLLPSETPSSRHVERYPIATVDFSYVDTPLLVAVWVLFASAAKIVYHTQTRLSKLFPESCLLIVIGIVLGVILHYASSGDPERHQLDTRTFFLVILPPIIIDAGYFMPLRPFFDQFGTIVLYAVLGTMMNSLLVGFTLWGAARAGTFGVGEGAVQLPLLHALVFASLLAAVDPVAVLAVFDSVQVNDILHIVVFGESLLNDGISVVLYHMFEGFSVIGIENVIAVDVVNAIVSFFVVILGATAIGTVCGLLGALSTRFTHHVRFTEPLIVFVVCYLSFLVAELFHLSGILSCTFCGITLRKYAESNVSQKSQTTIKFVFKVMASVSEAIIFMYLGIAAVSTARHWNTPFIVVTLLLCLVFRSIGVIVLTYVANRVRLVRLGYVDQFVMAYGGLRGAIAFALASLLDPHEFPSRSLFVTTTIVIIYFTNFVMGSTMQPLVKLLNVKRNEKNNVTMNDKICLRVIDHIMAGIEDISKDRGHHLIRERFSYYSNRYLKSCISRQRSGRGSEIVRVYQQLVERDALQLANDNRCAAYLARLRSDLERTGLDRSDCHRLSATSRQLHQDSTAADQGNEAQSRRGSQRSRQSSRHSFGTNQPSTSATWRRYGNDRRTLNCYCSCHCRNSAKTEQTSVASCSKSSTTDATAKSAADCTTRSTDDVFLPSTTSTAAVAGRVNDAFEAEQNNINDAKLRDKQCNATQ